MYVKVVENLLKEAKVGADQTVAWANNDPANTQKTFTIAKPANPLGEYELIIVNLSTETDITVKLFNVETALGGGSRDAFITSFSAPKSQAITGTTINTYVKFVHGIFNGGDFKAVLSNDTLIGAAGAFSLYFRMRQVS